MEKNQFVFNFNKFCEGFIIIGKDSDVEIIKQKLENSLKDFKKYIEAEFSNEEMKKIHSDYGEKPIIYNMESITYHNIVVVGKEESPLEFTKKLLSTLEKFQLAIISERLERIDQEIKLNQESNNTTSEE